MIETVFDRIKRLYKAGTMTEKGVKNATRLGLITADQYEEITGEDYTETADEGSAE